MNKLIPIALIIALLLGVSAILAPPIMAAPTIQRPMDLFDITIQGGSPQTVDYSWCYDTASGEIIQNTMDTLLMWNGESSSSPYIFAIATSEVDGAVTNTGQSTIGVPNPPTNDSINGLNFENNAQPGPNATYYWQYDFKIRQGVEFAPPYNYSLSTADVAYSFQRTILQDRVSGPQWMLQEPLLDQAAGLNEATTGGLITNINSTYAAQEAEVGQLVYNAIGYNATDVWFNLMFPGAYAPFLEILCQTWGSIESKQWINYQVIQNAGRLDWPGFYDSTYGLGSNNMTGWVPYWNPSISPLDSPTPMMYGSGPYMLTSLSYSTNEWTAVRNYDWWGGAPAFYPSASGELPAGYANTIEVSWNYAWATALFDFTHGQCDFAALPSLADMPQLYTTNPSPNGEYYPYPSSASDYPSPGIRCYAPLAELEVDGLFFTFNISSATPYGVIEAPVTGGSATFNPAGIPSNFFGGVAGQVNPYGIDMRKAFAYSIDYATEISEALLGEGMQPATAIIPGLYGYNASITGYNYNLTMATQYFQDWPNLWNNGFSITLCYNTGNAERQELCELLQGAIQGMNSNFKVSITNLDWDTYLTAAVEQELSSFVIGWLVDFPDPHDFALPFYHTGGAFASWQLYSNSTMDALINQAITLPNGNARQNLYNQIAELAIADCPSVTVVTPTGRHFEYDWVQGWYYNPIYPGLNLFNEYKYYYWSEASVSAPAYPYSEYLPADVNRDGTVNMKDIASIARAFGAAFTEPVPPNWQYTDDIVNIRQVTMRSIAYVARQFGYTSSVGQFGPIFQGATAVSANGNGITYTEITQSASVIGPTGSVTFTAKLASGFGPASSYQWYLVSNSTGSEPAPTPVGTASTYTFTPSGPGSYGVFVVVTQAWTGSVLAARQNMLGSTAANGVYSTYSQSVTWSEWCGVYVT